MPGSLRPGTDRPVRGPGPDGRQRAGGRCARAGLPPRPGSAWTATPHAARLTDLRRWADAVVGQQYSGYELPGCWPHHIHAIWELSTLAAEWHHTYGRKHPDLARALEFHDRWLPTPCAASPTSPANCRPQCVTLRGPGDRDALPLIPLTPAPSSPRSRQHGCRHATMPTSRHPADRDRRRTGGRRVFRRLMSALRCI